MKPNFRGHYSSKMFIFLICVTITMTSLVACTNESNKSAGENKTTADTSQPATTSNASNTSGSSIKGIIGNILT
jgi:ABC-type oligopeptide transport system substrate-binding subunit